MTLQEELELLLHIMHKHDLPMSPILEYAINEKLQAGPSCSPEMSVAEETADEDIKDASYYKERFAQLSTGVHNGKKLPHKAILLLSIMTLYEGGTIKDNKIELTNAIAHTFTNIWESYHLGDKVPSVWIPFWYMKSEPFWHFKACTDEYVLQNLLNFAGHPSVGQMRSVIAYAYLDEPLYEKMQDKAQRDSLYQVLIDAYIKNN